MRLRNIPEAKGIVENSKYVIKAPEKRRGLWKQDPSRQLFLEIGMGKGRFLMELSGLHPENEYIGLERYESVLCRACEKMEGIPAKDPASILEEKENGRDRKAFVSPENLHFLSMDAARLPEVFAPGETDGIFLNFSDPWPKARHAKRRLTSAGFLAIYEKILKDGGTLEFKTDNRILFDFSVQEIGNAPRWEITELSYDLHHDPVLSRDNIMTEYERKFSALGNKICKLTAVCHK